MSFNWTILLTTIFVWVFAVTFFGSNNNSKQENLSHSAATYSDSLDYDPPRFSERREERNQMVEEAVIDRGITDSATVQAMRNVPRHMFMPPKIRGMAYRNRPLPIGHQQTISQPTIVATMTKLLDLDSNDKVLEIGTGSGYQAAVLSEITPYVFTIEIVEPLGRQARKRFKKLGYSTIKTKIGDGYKGWEEHAPYDAIIITAAAPEIPKPLIDQLKTNGIMVMPLGESGGVQMLTRIRKKPDGELQRERVSAVRFVPMTGDIQEND